MKNEITTGHLVELFVQECKLRAKSKNAHSAGTVDVFVTHNSRKKPLKMAQNVVDETLVKQFNGELVSLYETKPPITKTKMVEITKAAMKAIKFYKHVVQSVEKFIMKCKPEYKLPGLYVIDSIVRQSRHQYGVDRDVFAPRFAKNMSATIEGTLKHCPEGDKVRIARVMHLWLKNVVFPEDCLKNCIEMAEGMGAHAGASSDEKSKPAPKPRKRSDDTNESKHAKQSRSRHEIQNDQPASPPAARPTPLSEQQTRAAAAPPPPPPPAEQHQKTDQLDPAFFEQIKTLTETIVEQQQKQKKGKTSSQFSRLLKSGFDYSDESGDDDDKDDEVNSSVNRTHDSSLSQQPPLPPPPPQQHTSHEDLLRKLQADAMGQPAAPPPSADNLNQMQSINSIPAPASTAASLLGPPPGNQPPPGFAPQNMPFDFSRPPPGFSAPPPGAAPSMPPSGAAPQQPQQQHMPSLLGAVAAAQPQAHFVAPPPSGGLGSPPSQAHLQPHPLQRDVCLRILPPRGPEPMPPGMGGAFGPAPVEQLEEQHGRKQHRRGQADENDAENHRSKRKRKHRSHSRSRSRSRRRGSRQPPVGDVQRDDSPEPIDAPPKRHRDKDRDRSDRDRDRGDKDRDHRRSHRADRDKDRSDRDGREQRSSRDRDRDRDRNRDKDRDKDRDTKERDRDHRTSRRSPERKSSSSRHHSRTADCSTTAEPSVPGMVPDSEPMPEPDKEKDIEKDRKKLGLPPVTVGITCLASRSLWLGRVPMTTSTEKLTEVFAEHIHGQVEHVDLLNAQGMAIVTLADRRDAVRVMERARTSLSVHGKALKVNWAMGKPIKDDPTLKEFWDAERGLSMIPWQRLPMDITPLCAAAHLDVSSMPPHLQELHTERGRKEPLASTSAGPTNQMQMPPMSMSGMPPAMMMGYGMPPPPFNIRPPGPAGFPFPPPMFGGPPGPRHGAIMHGGPGGDGGPPRTPVGAQHAGGEQASGASRPPWSAPPGAGGAPRGDRFGGPRFERGGGRGGAPFTPRGPSGGGFEGGRFGGGRGGPPERGRGGRFDGGRGSRFDGGRGGGFDGGRGGGRGFRGNTRDRQPYPDRRPERNFGGETEERRRPSRWMAEDAEPDRNGKGDAGEMKPDAVEKPAKSSGAVEPSSAVTAPEPELDENQKMMALMGLPVGFGVDKPEKEFE